MEDNEARFGLAASKRFWKKKSGIFFFVIIIN